MVLLPKLTSLRLSGADAGDFLHNQLSADILALATDESTFACYCEPKGRVLALMLVSRQDDDFLVILSAELAESICKRLRMYVMRSKVEIEVQNELTVVGLDSDDNDNADIGSLAKVTVPNTSKTLLITSELTALAEIPALANLWKFEELRAGIVWLCQQTSGQFLPQMLGYDQMGAVNFRKGCYPGQEIVARTHYLGKVKRHPRLLCTTAMNCPAPLEKLDIYSGDQSYSAVVTDCTYDEDGGACIYVVTRMDPKLVAVKIKYQDQEVELKAG